MATPSQFGVSPGSHPHPPQVPESACTLAQSRRDHSMLAAVEKAARSYCASAGKSKTTSNTTSKTGNQGRWYMAPLRHHQRPPTPFQLAWLQRAEPVPANAHRSWQSLARDGVPSFTALECREQGAGMARLFQ